MKDPMEQLRAAQPMPRGERLATWWESRNGSYDPSTKTWFRLRWASAIPHSIALYSHVPSVDRVGVYGADQARMWAAPLALARERRRRERAEEQVQVMCGITHRARMLRMERDALRAQLERLEDDARREAIAGEAMESIADAMRLEAMTARAERDTLRAEVARLERVAEERKAALFQALADEQATSAAFHERGREIEKLKEIAALLRKSLESVCEDPSAWHNVYSGQCMHADVRMVNGMDTCMACGVRYARG